MGSTKMAVPLQNTDTDASPLTRVETTALAECEAVIKDNLVGFVAVGEAFKRINEERLYRDTHTTFEEYCNERWEFDRQRAYQLINGAAAARNICNHLQVMPACEAHVRSIAKLKSEKQIMVWKTATEQAEADRVPLTAALVKDIRDSIQSDQESLGSFNRTNENINWAKWSWNPVTGCKHGCPYCYAKVVARTKKHLFPRGFKPHFRKERLAIPAKMEKMKLSDSDKDVPGIRNVFTCSMADLFGNWIPARWIDKVMAAVRKAPSWTFLFLTKNPERLVDIDWPENAWAGATVDRQDRVKRTIKAMKKVKAKVRLISCEPLLEELKFPTLECIDWVIIGPQSENGDLPEKQPEVARVISLIDQARKGGCKVYCKPSLKWSLEEYPGD